MLWGKATNMYLIQKMATFSTIAIHSTLNVRIKIVIKNRQQFAFLLQQKIQHKMKFKVIEFYNFVCYEINFFSIMTHVNKSSIFFSKFLKQCTNILIENETVSK